MHLALAIVGLAVCLAVALARPSAVPEGVVAAPIAVLLVLVGAVSSSHARDELSRLGPVVGFLAAVLVLAAGAAGEQLFQALGERVGRRAGSPTTLLAAVIGLAAVVTALLSLDTTVVLLTPVVVATVCSRSAQPRPPLYATVHLS